MSVFLPIAAAGVFAHVDESDDKMFVPACIASLFVYATSRIQESLGLSSIAFVAYLWSYAEFKTQRRVRRLAVARRLLEEEQINFAHVEVSFDFLWYSLSLNHSCYSQQIPNWLSRPDVDRVEWLNRLFTTYA